MSLINEIFLANTINASASPKGNSSHINDIDLNFVVETCETSLGEMSEKRSFDNIITKCDTVLSMQKNISKRTKHIEKEFEDIRTRVNSNSEYLQKLKKKIDNLNFSGHTKTLEFCRMVPSTFLETNTAYTRETVTQEMDKIREKVNELKSKTFEKPYQQQKWNSYREVMDEVINKFQQIENETDNF